MNELVFYILLLSTPFDVLSFLYFNLSDCLFWPTDGWLKTLTVKCMFLKSPSTNKEYYFLQCDAV
jgi:hypothetical protein